ncbi:hypothetical protein MKX67_15275 [Cytobacillus sp. FSL W7-1323]|nr:hypothetical protein [Cytobacillus kochii]MCM3344498.1 hypothetical protein [Cytobacillus kochii]
MIFVMLASTLLMGLTMFF